MDKLILASSSPRRAELLEQLGIQFQVKPADFIESIPADTGCIEAVKALAESKMRQFRELFSSETNKFILTADTLVECDHHIIGKAKELQEAKKMLRLMSGKEHFVHTGLCLFCPTGETVIRSATTSVFFKPLSTEDIRWYFSDNEWQGVAGAYRIQGKAAAFIEMIKGSYSNVVGLPIETIYGMLRAKFYPLQ